MTARTAVEAAAIGTLAPLASPLRGLLGTGKSGQVHALGDDKVAKVFDDHWPWRAVTDEWAASRVAHGHGITTPAPHALVNANGKPAIVYERVDGVPLSDTLRRQPWSVNRAMAALARLQHAVHCQPAAGLRTQASMLSYSIGQLKDQSDAQIALWQRALTELGGSSLCHNDFHANNVLVRNDELVVIDWGKGAVGSGALDAVLAYLKLRNTARSSGTGQWVTRGLAAVFARCYRRDGCIAQADFEALIPLAGAALRRDDGPGERHG